MIVNLELIIGKELRDINGKRAGRIAEVHGQEKGREFLITHYIVVMGWIGYLRHELGFRKRCRRRHVPWEQIDLRDPLHPKLLCKVEDLKQPQL